MSLIYYTNTKILIAGSILRTLGNANANSYTPFTIGMTIYSGTAPTPSTIAASWASYNSSTADYLVHYTDVTWGMLTSSSLMVISTLPTIQTPVHTGTAAWAILWAGQPSGPQLSGSILPFSDFLVVGVGNTTSDGVVRFASTSLVTGTPVNVAGGSMLVNL